MAMSDVFRKLNSAVKNKRKEEYDFCIKQLSKTLPSSVISEIISRNEAVFA